MIYFKTRTLARNFITRARERAERENRIRTPFKLVDLKGTDNDHRWAVKVLVKA